MRPEAQWISIKEAIDFGSDREILPKHAVGKLLGALIEERIRSRAKIFTKKTSEIFSQDEDRLLHGFQWKLASEQDGISFYESTLRYSIDVDNGIGQIFRDVYKAIDVEVYSPHLKNIWPEAELPDNNELASKSRAKGAGGRPLKHDWVSAAGFASGYIIENDYPSEQAKLEELIKEFFQSKGIAPDKRDIERFVEEIYQHRRVQT